MATIERTRPALWVQLTVLGNWYLVLGQNQQQNRKQHQQQTQTQTNPNLIRAFSRSFAAQNRLHNVNEVRA